MNNQDPRAEVLKIGRSIKQHARGLGFDETLVGVALLEAGLEFALADFTAAASPAEKKLIRSHRPEASEDDICAHRLTPKGVGLLLSLMITATRKYLDHQPETCATLDASADDAAIGQLVSVVTRDLSNAFASAGDLKVATYDVATATITNASILATERGVALEQLATIHLECIWRALESSGSTYGAAYE